MKNIKFIIVVLCFLLPLPACSNQAPKWQHDGTVSFGDVNIKTGLQNVYSALIVPGGVFLAGYKIDKQGVNYPYTVYVDEVSKGVKLWQQNKDVKDFFLYQEKAHFVDVEGGVQVYSDKAWHKAGFNLKPGSVVVLSEDFIVACKPAPMMKVAMIESGFCYSPQKKWEVKLSWRQVRPSICNGILTVVEDSKPKIVAHQIDIQSGNTLKSKILVKKVKDACHAF